MTGSRVRCMLVKFSVVVGRESVNGARTVSAAELQQRLQALASQLAQVEELRCEVTLAERRIRSRSKRNLRRPDTKAVRSLASLLDALRSPCR